MPYGRPPQQTFLDLVQAKTEFLQDVAGGVLATCQHMNAEEACRSQGCPKHVPCILGFAT